MGRRRGAFLPSFILTSPCLGLHSPLKLLRTAEEYFLITEKHIFFNIIFNTPEGNTGSTQWNETPDLLSDRKHCLAHSLHFVDK